MDMDFSNLSNKVAIVTGAGQGIGRAIAEQFVAAGASVVIAEIDPAAGRPTADRLAMAGKAMFVETDVADESAVREMVAKAVATFGRIDCLVNNAAISRNGPVTRLSLVDWQRVLAVNLTGPMLCAKHAASHLAASRGAIVNIASTRAIMSEANTEAYSATKAGLVGLTHALAVSLGPAVRANCISPGWIDTRQYRKEGAAPPPPLTDRDHSQHPAGRVGVPADIASMVLYLCSDEAGFITGQNFVIDGGMTKKMIYV
jgi:NAD(P)-dependent dehydrogenase (short-subunit alcohol dehydrogenase family)